MGLAWVGPLYWIQWAGGRRRLNSPRAAERSGRRMTPPGLSCWEAQEADGGRIQGIRTAIESASAHWLNDAPTAGLPRRAGEGEARRGSPCLAEP